MKLLSRQKKKKRKKIELEFGLLEENGVSEDLDPATIHGVDDRGRNIYNRKTEPGRSLTTRKVSHKRFIRRTGKEKGLNDSAQVENPGRGADGLVRRDDGLRPN